MVAREDFFERVWELVAEIPCGRVATYGQLADMLGIHGMPGWLEPPCAMHRKVCHATGSSLPTGAVPPAGQSRKCCFCEKAFPFAQRQGRPRPLSLEGL